VRSIQLISAALFGLLLSCSLVFVGYAETLDEAWATALAQNQRVAAAHLDSEAAADSLGAVAAERAPTLSVRSAYTARSDEPSFLVDNPLPGFGHFEFPYAERDAASAGAEVRVPLYTGGRITHSIESAAARQTASEWSANQTQLDVLFSVGEAYLDVLRLEREVDAAQIEWGSLAAHSAVVATQESQGRASQGDTLAAQVATADARQRWMQAQRQLSVARAKYNRLLGRPVTVLTRLEDPQFPPLSWDFDQRLMIAYDRRPDLRSMSAAADAHALAASSVRDSSRPQITATVGAQYEQNRFVAPDSMATAAVIVDWNLYNHGKTDHLADAEQACASSTRCLAEDLKAQIAVDLLAAYNVQADTTEQLGVAAQRIALANENLRTAQLRFDQRMALNSAVLEAQAALAAAQRDERQVHYRRAWAQLRMRYLAGLLCDSCTALKNPVGPSE
jgi:outer membrane protein